MDAKEALANLKTPEYQNPSEKIKISTAGSDLIREEGQRTQANILNSLQGGSARNIFSAIPGLMAMNNNINQKAGLNIDNQMQKREYAIAASQERLNAIEENRYQGEIAGIGNMYNQGNQQMWNGIRGTISAAGTIVRGLSDDDSDDDSDNYKKKYGYIEDPNIYTKDYGMDDYGTRDV